MGKTQSTGNLTNALAQDSSNNIGIGGAANASFKLQVTGATNLTGALSGTSATFSSGLGIATTPLAGNLSISTSAFSNAGTKSYTADNVGGISAYVSSQDPYRGYLDIYSTRSGDGGTLGGSIIRFLTSSVSSSVNAIERMAITQAGNVGIGTTFVITPYLGAGQSGVLQVATNVAKTASGGPHPVAFFGSNDATYPLGLLIQTITGATTGDRKLKIQGTEIGVSANSIVMQTDGGNVSIGTATDYGYKLAINSINGLYITGSSAVGHTPIVVQNTGGGNLFVLRGNGQTELSTFVYGNTVNTSPRTLYIESGTGALGGISSIRASKKNIEDFNSKWIYDLQPVQFNYRKKDEDGNYTNESYDELFYGLIAEDTAPIADFLVNYNDKEDGTKEMVGIEYMRLITPMLKAIQEQQAQIEELNELIKNK